MECADLGLRVGHQLLGNGLRLAGLDVQSALKNVRGAKGTNPWLVALHGCQIVGSGVLQKLAYTFHTITSIVAFL